MDTAFYLTILFALWFASAIISLYFVSLEGWVEEDEVVWASVFGPVSFLVMAWGAVEDDVMRLVRRARRWVQGYW